MKLPKLTRSTIIVGAVIAVLLIIIAVLGWKYIQSTKPLPQSNSEQTAARVEEAVGKLYVLPTKEKPTIAQIQDKSKLGNQEFFAKAENGDYLLLYKESKLALVYREGVNKLVNVGPINLDDQPTTNNTQPSTTKP